MNIHTYKKELYVKSEPSVCMQYYSILHAVTLKELFSTLLLFVLMITYLKVGIDLQFWSFLCSPKGINDIVFVQYSFTMCQYLKK